MKRILMILDTEFPPDSRVEKEIQSMIAMGIDLHIAVYTMERRKKEEFFNGYTIHRKSISKLGYKTKAFPLLFPYYFNFWSSFTKQLHKKYNFSIVIAHDLPMARIANNLKRKFGIMSICDQHEYYSDWIVKTKHMNTFLGKIVSALSNWKTFEKKELTLCDLVLTVAEPLRQNYIQEYNLPKDKILTIPNTPAKKTFSFENIKQEITDKYKNSNMIFYAGGIDILRGIDVAIKAMPKIIKQFPNAQLVLAGKIVNNYDPLKIAQTLGVKSHVSFIGWVNEADLPSYIHASKICFFTPPANRDEINMTIATKIYQYAIMKKPMIVGSAKLMKEYVESNGIGFAIDETKPDEFADKAKTILGGNFSMNEATSFLNWEDTVLPLTNFVQKSL